MATKDALLKVSPAQHIAQRKNERSPTSEILKFPANLGAHATLMRFFQYTYGGVRGAKEQKLAEVLLPLPKQIQDSFKINVGGDEIGLTGSIAAQISGGLGGNESGIGNALKKFDAAAVDAAEGILVGAGKTLMGNFSALQEGLGKAADTAGFLARNGLSKISPDLANGIGVGRGTAVNPFATLVFKGVDLKVHSLEWLLSPETEAEQKELKEIISTIQRMVLPSTQNPVGDANADFGLTAVDKGILKYPAMVNIYLQGLDQNYYFKFKTSMISQFNVDYTPNGLAVNKGGKPNAVRLTMTLNEAYIHTADDHVEAELIQDEVPEQFTGDSEDRDTTSPVSVDETYNAGEDFHDSVAQDEVEITQELQDGTTTTSTVLASELNDNGITDAVIDSGEIPGQNVRLRRGRRGSVGSQVI